MLALCLKFLVTYYSFNHVSMIGRAFLLLQYLATYISLGTK